MEEDKAYICPCCGQISTKPSKLVEDYSPYGSFGNGAFLCELDGCPKCGSGMHPAWRCDMCMEYKEDTRYYDELETWLCDDCHQLVDGLEYLKDE